MYDIAIIGAGITGAALARELMRYKLSVCILEKESDVAMGASRANSGIIHGGFDPEPGTLKARLNVRGIELLYRACRELSVPHRKNGSLVVAFSEEENRELQKLYLRGKKNQAPETFLLSGEEARKLEPRLSEAVTAALYAPSAGIVCPYELTIAAIGNAMDNGAELYCNFSVCKIEHEDGFTVHSRDGRQISCRYLINCAGGYSDKIAALLRDDFYKIIPRSGEYLLLDKNEGKTVQCTVFQVPNQNGKGVLVTPTADGNLLLGPTASPVETPDSTATTVSGLDFVTEHAKKSVPSVSVRAVITSFCGVRASCSGGDFIIAPSRKIPGFIHVAGIDSPGLTASFAVAEYVISLLQEAGLELSENGTFTPFRSDVHFFRSLDNSAKNEYIKAHGEYGKILCRCEGITEGEILDVIRRNPVPHDTDGVKRRTRAGMGRCQGGFCLPSVMELLRREQKLPPEKINKSGENSPLVYGKR